MSTRRTRLADCSPSWVVHDGIRCGLRFACPEGREDCWHVLPFSPPLEGGVTTSWQENGACWSRTGDTFGTLTLSPSIRRIPVPGYDECALHIFIREGMIEFCSDSR